MTQQCSPPGPHGLLGFRPVADLRSVDGRRVGAGLLYRSATPQFTTSEDAEGFVEATGLKSVVDLRLPHESAREGSGGFTATEVAIVNIPFSIRKTISPDSAVAPMASADPLVGTYVNYLTNPAAFRQIVELWLTDHGLPVLVHCTVGKDRTGVAFAVVLDAIGILRPDIVANYSAQREDVVAMMGRLRDMASYGAAVSTYPPEASSSAPATVLRFLACLDIEYGGARAYLNSAGISSTQLDQLADRLLTTDEGEPMAQITQSIVIDAPVEEVWRLIGEVGNVHAWVPSLSATRMNGDVRTVTFVDGGEAREEIIAHSDTDRSYTYTYLDGPIALEQYESTLAVGPHHSGSGTLVTWVATLQADPAVVTSIEELYAVSLAELQKIVE